jgi:hypothetical protein
MLSHQQARNDISGKKTIILNPTAEQKNGTEVVTFAEGVCPNPFSQLTVGNLLFGYPRIDRDRSCSSHKFPYYDLRQDRIYISSQTKEFSIRVE